MFKNPTIIIFVETKRQIVRSQNSQQASAKEVLKSFIWMAT